MSPAIRLFIRHTVFWLIQFIFFRICFLAWLGPWDKDIPFGHMLFSLVAGWKLDLSASAYLFLIPFLLSVWLTIQRSGIPVLVIRAYYILTIAITVLLQTGNIAIYRFWGILLNNRAVAFAADPLEVAASLTTIQFILISAALILLITLNVFLFNRIILPCLKATATTKLKGLLWHVPVAAILILSLRGGLQQIPVNESSAYYSLNGKLNHIAVNSLWHLGNSLRQASAAEGNPYQVMNDDEAASIAEGLIGKNKGTSPLIFRKTEKPNVVILILESWTADIIEPLGGIKGVTPFFTELSESGLLFTGIYSSGFRTDQGIISVLSGFPAQPHKSIIRFPDKTRQLPCLAQSLAERGYSTSFYYGGELGFANMKTYLLSGGFNQLTGKDDFPSDAMNSKWGAHDGVVLSRQTAELDTIGEPFFSVLLTLSTHEPFEVPVTTPFNGAGEPELFKKAAWYTDLSLREYFTSIQSKKWFDNTIFVLVADHGHRLPLDRAYEDPKIRRIPLLIWSPLLADSLKGKTIEATGTQHDIPATLLQQLGIGHVQYYWSNDLLQTPRNNYAYQSLDESIIWITPGDTLVLPLDGKGRSDQDGNERDARAFLQTLYRQFISF